MSAASVERFIRKWKRSELKERSAAQEHFIDICRLIGHATPAEADPKGESFCFEMGAEKTRGGEGYADVWKQGCFAWEYKGKRKNLGEAYLQVAEYRDALQNPPLLIVCDTDRFEIHTNFNNTAKRVYAFSLSDLSDGKILRLLQDAFSHPERLSPQTTATAVTTDAASKVSRLAEALEQRGVEPRNAAHFLMQIVFCMFAESIELLPKRLFSQLLDKASTNPKAFDGFTRTLFAAMAKGGSVGFELIPWFNGGLFTDDSVIPLRPSELEMLREVAKLDWAPVEPAIFGTLFERGLDPRKRQQIGAHYTSPDDIRAILEPVVLAPLREEWRAAQGQAEEQLLRSERSRSIKTRRDARRKAEQCIGRFHERLRTVRILDPACGSGNFLYLALRGLKDLEGELIGYAARRELGSYLPFVSPVQLHGIESDTYAHELAQVVVWIGHLQWLYHNAFVSTERPILKAFENILCRDALLPTSNEWPAADYIVGNPPFLGGKLLRRHLGDEYVNRLFDAYGGRVARESDLVCYWFERARRQIECGKASRVGFVATNSIRSGANRKTLEMIVNGGAIFMAHADRPWVLDGADVRVSMVGFDDASESQRTLDGQPVSEIYADLTSGIDLTRARPLVENAGIAFMGDSKGGAFNIPSSTASELLKHSNPLRKKNSDVVRRWVHGSDVSDRPGDLWIIDFGVDMPEREAALYQAPFEYVKKHVKPKRELNRRQQYAEKWWIHVEPRRNMRDAFRGLSRYLATTRHSKYRIFVFFDTDVLPDSALIAFARDDWFTFGILQSKLHVLWADRMGSFIGVGNDPRYTPSSTFETFPFPRATEGSRMEIEAASRDLYEARESALVAESSATMTGLYNDYPTWLAQRHATVDRAVMKAYGWPMDLEDNEILLRLLALNIERANAESNTNMIRVNPSDSIGKRA